MFLVLSDSMNNKCMQVKALSEELGMVNKTVKSMSLSGERSADMEDNIQDKIRELKQRSSKDYLTLTYLNYFSRLSASEVRAENAERAATRLQGEADSLQGGLLQEKQRGKRMEEDMQGLVSSLENI